MTWRAELRRLSVPSRCVSSNRYVDNVISAPADASFWRINAKNDVFFAKVL